MTLAQFMFSLDHCLHTVVHILHKGNLAHAKSSLVRNVIDVIVSLGMFTVSTSDLHMEFVCDSLKLSFPLTQKREVDMN